VIRVLLVDDQPLVRAGLRRILRPRAGFEVVGECDDGDQVEQAVAATRPDVVVMDVRMKRVDGAEATRRLRARDGSPPPIMRLSPFPARPGHGGRWGPCGSAKAACTGLCTRPRWGFLAVPVPVHAFEARRVRRWSGSVTGWSWSCGLRPGA
jgi:Response regulator receiver domain